MSAENLDPAWESIGCDLCGGKDATSFITAFPKRAEANAPYRLVKCLGCGLVFLNPRPSERGISKYYGSDYYAHSGMKSRQRNLKVKLKSRFLDALGGYDQRTLDLRLIHRFVPIGFVDVIIPNNRRGKLLDVGCGDGERADWYRSRGFDVYGVEISERGAAKAREAGIGVYNGSLTESGFPDSFFDVVVMAHVLEHTHSPRKYLAEAFRILKPGGMLAVAVPNIEAYTASVFKGYWRLLMPPIHLYHFSIGTLTTYLSNAGFGIHSLVGKTVYPKMVRNSLKAMRGRAAFSTFLAAWLRSGIIASSWQHLRWGASKCDAITAYCGKAAG